MQRKELRHITTTQGALRAPLYAGRSHGNFCEGAHLFGEFSVSDAWVGLIHTKHTGETMICYWVVVAVHRT